MLRIVGHAVLALASVGFLLLCRKTVADITSPMVYRNPYGDGSEEGGK